MSNPFVPAEPIMHAAAAWSAAMGDVRAVGKDSKNNTPGATYMFRGIDAVMNAAGPAFRAHGVVVMPHKVKTIEYTTVTVGRNQTVMASVRLIVVYRIYGPAGDWFRGEAPGEAFDSGDKATSKAMSVAYRTLLIQGLTLPTGDADPDADTHERSRHDPGPEQARDLGQWRGRVAAAGTDQSKLRELWQQMKAEWDQVAWSQERLDILQPAVDAAKPAEPVAAVSAPGPTGQSGATVDEQAEIDFYGDLGQAEDAKDLKTIRLLIGRAATAGQPKWRADAQAVLNGLREA